MTRLIVIAVIFFLVYWFARTVIRGFLRGLGIGNGNMRSRGEQNPKDTYKDVQDAEFKDISDES